MEQVSSDCVKIESDTAPVFFMRFVYLMTLSPERVVAGTDFTDEEAAELVQAGLAFAAEQKAYEYLCRAEHSRSGLYTKLLQKGMDKDAVNAALDYLEGRRYLSDARFAESWLRTHLLGKAQGRTRLLSELLARGVGRETAKEALDAYFEEHSEDELCERALEKALRAGKTGDKLMQSLLASGFSYKQIKAALAASSGSAL
ncbi:MAG: recombination regulator RecX [Treponema sp.]|nr:recombination regulator RecX [Treponema sp.]